MAGQAQRTGTQAIERALGLLTELERQPGPLPLTELARRTGLSPSTAHRLARALCDQGLLQQHPVTERYGLGRRLVALGQRAASSLGLDAAREVLDDLADRTGESVNLGVRDGDEVLVLLCVASSQRLRFDQAAGSRVPMHASAMGKALLAFTPDLDAALHALPRLARITGHTITSRPALRAELDEVATRGWALNDEEREVGVRTIAAPVLGPDRAPIAAVAVQGPAVRLADDRLERLVPSLLSSAGDLASGIPSPP